MATHWTWQLIFTLTIASFALVTSVGVLVWQIVSWVRTGPRVSVEARWSMTFEEHPDEFYTVSATNSGRTETQVSQFGFQLPDGTQLIELHSYFMPVTLPLVLPPGGTVEFTYSIPWMRRSIAAQDVPVTSVRPFVQTGHGRVHGQALKRILALSN